MLICRINARSPISICGRPPRDRDLERQYRQKPARCQRTRIATCSTSDQTQNFQGWSAQTHNRCKIQARRSVPGAKRTASAFRWSPVLMAKRTHRSRRFGSVH